MPNAVARAMMKVKIHEDRSCDAARMFRRAGSLSPVRRRHEADSLCSPFHACAPGESIQKKGFDEPEPARPEAQNQAFGLGPRLPRHGLVDCFCFFDLAGEFRIGKAFTNDCANTNVKAFRVGHFAVVKSPGLFVDVAEQMEWLHADISSVQAPLQETPEIFHSVSVNISVYVLNGMIDDGVLVVCAQSIVRLQFIAEDCCARFDVLTDLRLQFWLASAIYYKRSDIAATFHHSHNHGFIFAASSGNDARSFRLVHISRFAADEGFIHFHFAAVLPLLREPDSMEQEPRALLGDAKSAGDFTTADAVPAVQNHPGRREPFVQTNWGILHDGSYLDRELPEWMTVAALPTHLILEEANASTSTPRAAHAVFPLWPSRHEIVKAIRLDREISDRFQQSLGFVEGFHTSIVFQNHVLVNYIITLIWVVRSAVLEALFEDGWLTHVGRSAASERL